MQLTETHMTVEADIRQLVQKACQYPPGHVIRQQCLTKIIELIERSGKLWHENTPYYEDALQQTWIYFCLNICEAGTGEQYDPDRSSVITWLNRYLKWRLQDFRMAQQTQKIKHISGCLPGALIKTRDVTANLAANPDIPPILEDTRIWAETDATGELRKTYVQDRPDVNCQTLILRRLPPESSWEELSSEFDMAISTLSSFYQRQCIKRLRKFGESQGYL